jgi:dihydrofolate reductase
MTITLIAAHSEDGIIAQNGRIPWHLPDDTAHFRKCCEGKWLLAGRRTWEQMQGWFRPGQTPVVVTRNAALAVAGGYAVSSVPAGFALAEEQGAPECMVIGGGEIYAAALPFADTLILTEVHTTLGTGTRFPAVKPEEWRVSEEARHEADAAHAFAFTIRVWHRECGPR